MHRLLPIFLCLLAAPLGAQERLVLPSGQEVAVHEIRWDDDAQTGRFRFIAPWISGDGGDMSVIHADMMTLCREFALPVLHALYPGGEGLVISFASEPVEFGAISPDVVQFFEGYAIAGQDCIWSQY